MSFVSQLNSVYLIATKDFTWHDTFTVVTSANICNDNDNINRVTVNRISIDLELR